MILNLMQTGKALCSASFVIKRSMEEIGTVSLQGKIWSMEASVCGTFYSSKFEMIPNRNAAGKKIFRPYLLKLDGGETGNVYQTIYKKGVFKSYEYHHMVKGGVPYDLFPVGFGNEGSRCPIYSGSEQIAQAEKDCLVYNDMHNYRILATDENAALTAVLFCMYMYVNACYKPGIKAASSKAKTVSVTTNELLKEKYDSCFRERIKE